MPSRPYLLVSIALFAAAAFVGWAGSSYIIRGSESLPLFLHPALCLGFALAGGMGLIADAISKRQP